MKILFIINTPSQAHMWIPIVHELKKKDHLIKLLVREYGNAVELVRAGGLECETFKPVARRSLRLGEIFVHLSQGLKAAMKTGVDLVIGFGIDATFLAGMLRKPSIIFVDNDPTRLQNNLARLFKGAIITPDCFRYDLGRKHIRLNGFKELVYLHPTYFRPDPSVLDEMNLSPDERFVILRFNAFDAVHDIGVHGFSQSDQHALAIKLSEHAKVFICQEGKLSPDLERFRISIPYDRIHHALYYSHLLVTDTGTMATEAAILGSPVVRCTNFTADRDFGNFVELEKKYGLMYSYRFNESSRAVAKALELIREPNLKQQWHQKAQVLLNEKTDVRNYLVNFIESCLWSFKRQKSYAV